MLLRFRRWHHHRGSSHRRAVPKQRSIGIAPRAASLCSRSRGPSLGPRERVVRPPRAPCSAPRRSRARWKESRSRARMSHDVANRRARASRPRRSNQSLSRRVSRTRRVRNRRRKCSRLNLRRSHRGRRKCVLRQSLQWRRCKLLLRSPLRPTNRLSRLRLSSKIMSTRCTRAHTRRWLRASRHPCRPKNARSSHTSAPRWRRRRPLRYRFVICC